MFRLRFAHRFVIAVIVVAFSPLLCPCDAATSRFMAFDLSRFSESDGSSSYHFDIWPSFVLPNTTLHLPDGSVIDFAPFSSPCLISSRCLTFKSFDELKSAFIGEWTFKRTFGSEQNPDIEVYNFDITGLPEDILMGAPPSINSPIDGSTVNEQFTLSWTRATGITPAVEVLNIELFGPGGSSGGHTGGIEVGETPVTEIDVRELREDLPDELELRIGDFKLELLNGFITDVTTDASDPFYEFSLYSRFTNYSTPVRVTVGQVPEPGAIVLCLLALTMLQGLVARRICRDTACNR